MVIVEQLLEEVKFMNRKLGREMGEFKTRIIKEEKAKNDKLFSTTLN